MNKIEIEPEIYQSLQELVAMKATMADLPDEIVSKYPEGLTPENVFSKQLRPLIKPLVMNLILQSSRGVEMDVLSKGIEIYFTLCSFNVGQWNNWENNDLLAMQAFEAAYNKEISLWRFVCLPEITLNRSEESFQSWMYTFGTRRFDTLTPTLPKDAAICERLQKIGKKTQLTYVFDDWEVLFLRCRNDYMSLPVQERLKAKDQLAIVRQAIKTWVDKILILEGISADVLFFSSLIEYESFCDAMDAVKLEPQEKIINAEKEFVKKCNPKATQFQIEKDAAIRVAQYAAEGAFVQDLGIFLASEYPVDLVCKKLTLLSSFPICFYVTDREVKNI